MKPTIEKTSYGDWEVFAPEGFYFSEWDTHILVAFTEEEAQEFQASKLEACHPSCDCHYE